MSLRIWLPLDGDLRNLGTSSDNFTINTAPVYVNNGKIGKAMSTGQITMPAQTAASILNNNSFSFACWIYVNAATGDTTNCAMLFGNSGMTAPNNRKFSIFQYPSCNDLHLSWQNDVNSTTFTGGVWSGYFPSYQWTHLAITYQNPNGTIYINGIKKATFSGTSNSASFEFNTVLFQNCPNQGRYLNDYRIYDHCLSAAEVHEIAQGLVLHYKLDDITYGIEDSSGYNRNAISNGSQPVTTISDAPRYSASANFIAGARIATPVAASQYLPVDAITTNIWIKSSNAANRFLSCTESGGWNFESTGGYVRVPLYISGKGYTYCNSSTTTWSSLSDNQWHMLSFTYDRQQLKIYIDGTIDTTADSAYPNINIAYRSNTPLTIGAESQTISSPIAGTYVGNISDLRIYCTALSAQDIKQLYELGMKIDNGHNLHVFEIVENNNRISLNNKRQFKCNEVVENELTKFFKREELVETHQIVEF